MASYPTRQRLDPERVTRRCITQKTCFRDYAAAHDVAEQMMDLGKVNPGCHITPYECAECDHWHVYNRIIVPLPGQRGRH